MSTTDQSTSESGLVISVSAILITISTLVFGLRLYTRCILLRTAGADDWTMSAAMLMAMICSITTCIEGKLGLGREIQTLAEEDIQSTFIWLFVTIFTYNLGLNIVKISFLLQYLRIFPNTILRSICRWGLVIIPIWTIIQQVLLSLTCTPLSIIVPSAEAWCLDTLNIWMLTSIVSLLTDFAIFLLPVPVIWDLQIPIRQKLIVFGIFGLGLVICIVSIIRVPTLRAAARAPDPTLGNINASLWTIAEINAAIICSSLPILRPLVFKVTANLTSMTRKTMTRSTTIAQPEQFPSHHFGHQLEDMPNLKDFAMNGGGGGGGGKISRREILLNDSSDDLVNATYDEMIYGRQVPPRPGTVLGSLSQAGTGNRGQSMHTPTVSDGEISIDMGMSGPPSTPDAAELPKHVQ